MLGELTWSKICWRNSCYSPFLLIAVSKECKTTRIQALLQRAKGAIFSHQHYNLCLCKHHRSVIASSCHWIEVDVFRKIPYWWIFHFHTLIFPLLIRPWEINKKCQIEESTEYHMSVFRAFNFIPSIRNVISVFIIVSRNTDQLILMLSAGLGVWTFTPVNR